MLSVRSAVRGWSVFQTETQTRVQTKADLLRQAVLAATSLPFIRCAYCTAIVTVFESIFAVVTITGTAFPEATPLGSCTFTW